MPDNQVLGYPQRFEVLTARCKCVISDRCVLAKGACEIGGDGRRGWRDKCRQGGLPAATAATSLASSSSASSSYWLRLNQRDVQSSIVKTRSPA
ncbi:unnamed protein product, partial [Iphiclides podalirius]